MTRTATSLVLILIVSTSMGFSAEQIETDESCQWTGSTEQRVWGLMTIWASAKVTFPHFDRSPELDWDRTVQEFIPRVIEAGNIDEYYHLLMELVALLEDSHTVVVPPWGHFKPGHDIPAFEIQIIDDRFFVARVGTSDELDQKGIVPGLEIIEINGGTPIAEYFEREVLRYYSRGSDHADQAILPIYLLFGPAGETVDLTIRDHDGDIRSVQVERNSIQRDGSPFMYRFVYDAFVASSVESKFLDEHILYVKIPNFEREEIASSFHRLLEEIDLSTTKGMVIDLRFNLGGSNAIGDSIVSSLNRVASK